MDMKRTQLFILGLALMPFAYSTAAGDCRTSEWTTSESYPLQILWSGYSEGLSDSKRKEIFAAGFQQIPPVGKILKSGDWTTWTDRSKFSYTPQSVGDLEAGFRTSSGIKHDANSSGGIRVCKELRQSAKELLASWTAYTKMLNDPANSTPEAMRRVKDGLVQRYGSQAVERASKIYLTNKRIEESGCGVQPQSSIK